jgi:hypothetical protein
MSAVIVEVMPAQYRESHRAARNWGVYPHNGAVRLVATREDAEALVAGDPDEYNEIVQDHVTPADREQYDDFVGQEL